MRRTIPWFGLFLLAASFVWFVLIPAEKEVALKQPIHRPAFKEPFSVVVFDPGHGGQDSGAIFILEAGRMSETSRALTYFLKQDPFVIMGLGLVGASAVFFFRLHQKLKEIGDRSYAHFTLPILFVFTIPKAYLRCAPVARWSRLPAYAAWLCTTMGVALLVLGLFRL